MPSAAQRTRTHWRRPGSRRALCGYAVAASAFTDGEPSCQRCVAAEETERRAEAEILAVLDEAQRQAYADFLAGAAR